MATVLAIAGSLAADAALVAIGTRLFPATKGYVHFQFDDYARLTVIGVVIACAAWPIVARVTLGAPLALLPPGHRGDAGALPARPLHLAPGTVGRRRWRS